MLARRARQLGQPLNRILLAAKQPVALQEQRVRVSAGRKSDVLLSQLERKVAFAKLLCAQHLIGERRVVDGKRQFVGGSGSEVAAKEVPARRSDDSGCFNGIEWRDRLNIRP